MMNATNTEARNPYFRVSYLHMRGYRVSRTFDTREAAQEFIDVNAMICPLPGVKLLEPGEDFCGCWNFTNLGHCIHTV